MKEQLVDLYGRPVGKDPPVNGMGNEFYDAHGKRLRRRPPSKRLYEARSGQLVAIPKGVAPTRRFSACAIVVRPGPEYLMVHPKGKRGWVFPGGELEASETPQQAAIREARQESGYLIAAREEVYARHTGRLLRRGAFYEWAVTFHVGYLKTNVQRVRVSESEDDDTLVCWVTREDLRGGLKQDVEPWLDDIVAQLLRSPPILPEEIRTHGIGYAVARGLFAEKIA